MDLECQKIQEVSVNLLRAKSNVELKTFIVCFEEKSNCSNSLQREIGKLPLPPSPLTSEAGISLCDGTMIYGLDTHLAERIVILL